MIHNHEAVFEALQVEYRQAQLADPFHADDMLVTEIPRLNQAADHHGLLTLLQTLLADAPSTESLSPSEAWAALRDLGFVIGPIKRYGVQPAQEIPQLETYLLQLAERANCLHPRDNVFTLTVANPTGKRMRTYTAAPSEYAFINAVGASMIAMDRCIADICTMLDYPLHSPHFAEWAQRATKTFRGVIDEVLSVRTSVDPDWFANTFTRNLEQIAIEGQLYHGPSADQTQMLLIDWLFYGQSSAEYVQFFASLQQHLRPLHREIIIRYDHSLLERVQRTYANDLALDAEQTTQSLQCIIRLLKQIRTFRYPHRKIAMDSFALRAETRQIGSGGMTPDSGLRQLIDWTEEAIDAFRAIATTN